MQDRKKKRILVFSLVYYPKHVHGGAEVSIKEITDRISKDEIEFHMVTLGYDSTLPKVSWEGNVLVHRIGLMRPGIEVAQFDIFPLFLNKYLFQFLAAWKAHLLHRKYRYDALWAVMAHSCGVPAALFKIGNPRVSYILTLQEGDPIGHIERAVRPLWPLFKRAFTRADTIQVISSFLGRWAKQMGYPKEPVLIPNGVDITHFSKEYERAELQAVKDELGKKEGDVFLITTSRLVKKNALDSVIRALSLLPAPVHFFIYGEGPQKSELIRLTEELNLEGRVHFEGLIGHDVMPKYLRACDIFIRPSRSEGMGNSFVEAMAAGIPVIASQEGGIRDFLFDALRNPDTSTTGWAVDPESPEDIRDAVLDIMAHKEKVREVTSHAFELVRKRHDWDLIAEAMHREVFMQIL